MKEIIEALLPMDWIKKKFGWICFFFGIAAYAVGIYHSGFNFKWVNVAYGIGHMLLVGGIMGALINTAKINNVFKDTFEEIKKDLGEIVDCEDYLKRRTDIDKIWKNATKALLNNKFPDIQDDLMETVRKYMVRDRVYYCEGFSKTTEIKLLDRTTGIIKVREVVKYDLVTDSTKQLDRSIKVTTIVRDRREYKCEMRYIKVNEEDMINKVKATEKIEQNGDTCKEWILPLQGNTRYTIQYERETEYNIKDDYFVGFKAANIIKNMSVDLTLGDGLEATFKSRGTQEEFDTVINDKRHIKMEYKGIVLPHQGYIFALRT